MERREFLAASAAGATALGTDGLPLPGPGAGPGWAGSRATRPGTKVYRVGLVGGQVVEEVLEPELIS